MGWEGKGGPRRWQDPRGPLTSGEGKKAGSKVPPAKRKAKRRKKDR
jgi:hypothetical protein